MVPVRSSKREPHALPRYRWRQGWVSSRPSRITASLLQPGQRTPSGQRRWRTKAKHLASSIRPERSTRSDAAMVAGTPCMSEVSYPRSRPRTRPPLPRDPVPTSPPRNPIRAANDCWQFDLSPSDLKQVPAPLWMEAGQGPPTLMLFSAVDDRSGVAYQEYRCVYGEDVAAALRFLFNAMAPKDEPGLVLQGIPAMLYLDNGPVAKSATFRRVMAQLGADVHTHMPRGSDGRRVTVRSKGKVERPFRTVKEAHETLYHFHMPQNEAEANLWLRNYLVRYNAQPHRSAPRSRTEDWLATLPETDLRARCTWDRLRTRAREPERRRVGIDARVQVDGISYEVDPSLASETVTLWWGS